MFFDLVAEPSGTATGESTWARSSSRILFGSGQTLLWLLLFGATMAARPPLPLQAVIDSRPHKVLRLAPIPTPCAADEAGRPRSNEVLRLEPTPMPLAAEEAGRVQVPGKETGGTRTLSTTTRTMPSLLSAAQLSSCGCGA